MKAAFLPLGSPRFAGADGKDRQTGRARSDAAGGTTPHRLTGLGGRGLQLHTRGAAALTGTFAVTAQP